MMSTIIWLLTAYGLCFAMQHKIPFLRGKVDLLDEMLHCTFCTGFHCGWMTWVMSFLATGTLPASGWHIPGSMLVWAFASAASCYVIDAGTNWLESHMLDSEG